MNPLSLLKKIKSIITNDISLFPDGVIKHYQRRILSLMSPVFSDYSYLKMMSKVRYGKSYDLENPKTLNEKLNWLKLYDRRPEYSMMADKIEAKKIVGEKIGSEYVVPLIASWERPEDIEFQIIPPPGKCVFKTTWDSSGVMIYTGEKEQQKRIIKTFKSRQSQRNYYWNNREWPYKNVKNRYFAEKLLDTGTESKVLTDYKFLCFNGVPKIMYVTNKSTDIFENFYDMDFEPLYISHGFRRAVPEFETPKDFEKMKELAAKLSSDIPFVRIDFFYVQGKIYFGEFTFYDWGGFAKYVNPEDDLKLGELLTLPLKNEIKSQSLILR